LQGTTVKQELFRQSRLARIRVRNDGKRATARRFVNLLDGFGTGHDRGGQTVLHFVARWQAWNATSGE
jgi:hypothetical protein